MYLSFLTSDIHLFVCSDLHKRPRGRLSAELSIGVGQEDLACHVGIQTSGCRVLHFSCKYLLEVLRGQHTKLIQVFYSNDEQILCTKSIRAIQQYFALLPFDQGVHTHQSGLQPKFSCLCTRSEPPSSIQHQQKRNRLLCLCPNTAIIR